MKKVAPEGPVYQAGTLSGNPLAMRAGLVTLAQLRRPGLYEELAGRMARLAEGLDAAARATGVTARVNTAGSLMTMFFTNEPVRDYASAKRSDTKRFARFFRQMLDRGILLPPSQFEALFLSAAHTDADIDRTVAAAKECFADS
jgi:glutamate-1-semialdehyde 2,1-aminomutase